MDKPSRLATASVWIGGAGLLDLGLGPAMTHLLGTPAMWGFYIFGLGVLGGLVALLLGCISLWRTRAGGTRPGRGRARLGTALGAAVVAVFALVLARGGNGDVPPFNDYTTDMNDPPQFQAAQQEAANQGRDLSYPAGEVSAAQRSAYPDLAPITISRPPAAVFTDVERAARELGWEITRSDPAAGALEARSITRVFRFVDDVVVRVRGAGGGSVVDIRSKSRDGRSDLGANAARIRAFRDELGG